MRTFLIEDEDALCRLVKTYGFQKLEVFENGVITFNGKALKHIPDQFGYPRVYYVKYGQRIGKYVHRLLAQKFIPNPLNKASVNHIDGDKTNYSLSNLEWTTPKENTAHAMKFLPKSSHPGRLPWNVDRDKLIYGEFLNGSARKELALKWKLSRVAIGLIIIKVRARTIEEAA